MPDENDAILDAIADWGFEPEPESQADPAPDPEPKPDPQDGGETPPEGSNETPTPQEKTYTEAEMKQWVAAQLQTVQTQAQQKQVSTEIQRLLSSDEPEDAQKLQNFIRTATEQQRTYQTVQSQVSSKYAEEVLTKVAPDEFIQALTPEQKSRIDPDKFNNDADFYNALIEVRAEIMAGKILAAKEAEATKAAEEARANKQKGDQLRQPSLAGVSGQATPSNGRESNDDLWSGAISEMFGADDE